MSVTGRIWITGFGVLLALSGEAAFVAPQATGLVVGRLIDSKSDLPILTQAVVTLAAQSVSPGDAPAAALPSAAPRVYSDGSGRFLFRNVPAGTYTITA